MREPPVPWVTPQQPAALGVGPGWNKSLEFNPFCFMDGRYQSVYPEQHLLLTRLCVRRKLELELGFEPGYSNPGAGILSVHDVQAHSTVLKSCCYLQGSFTFKPVLSLKLLRGAVVFIFGIISQNFWKMGLEVNKLSHSVWGIPSYMFWPASTLSVFFPSGSVGYETLPCLFLHSSSVAKNTKPPNWCSFPFCFTLSCLFLETLEETKFLYVWKWLHFMFFC